MHHHLLDSSAARALCARRCCLCVVGLLAAGCALPPPPAPVPAAPLRLEPVEGGHADREGETRAIGGIGFTRSPDTLLLTGEVDFFTLDRLAIGPMLQWGIDDDETIVAPSFQAKYFFPIGATPGGMELLPFVQAGVGFAWLQRDDLPGDDDDVGLLLQAGGGIELLIDDHLSLSSSARVDLLPGEVLDEHSYWSWQLLAIGVRF